MKVYRFLNWANPTTVKEKSFQNEINNYREGLISPSHIFLQQPNFQIFKGANTFGFDTEMSKYFFASIADAMSVFSYLRVDNVLIEIDLPEEVLRTYIGVGFYELENRPHIEFRVPYQVLYENLAEQRLDYFDDALKFYNAHLNASLLEKVPGYDQIEKLLTQVPYHNISFKNRLNIYPLFCFKPKYRNFMEFEESELFRLEMLAKNFQENRNKTNNYNSTINSVLERIENQQDILFDVTYPLLSEENDSLKRILTK